MSEIIISDNFVKAESLNKKIKANSQILQETLFELGNNLKEMRDGKLYKELGYEKFEEYTEVEVGIKRRQSYCYISIVENLSEEFVQSTAQIGTQKLYLLSRVDEVMRAEIIENTDLSNTSVKELEDKLSQLKARNQQLEEREEEYNKIRQENENMQKVHQSTKNQISRQVKERERAETELEQTKSLLKDSKEENLALIQRIDELESRPVDVAVADNSEEIQRINDEHKSQIYELQNKHNSELETVRAEYEERLKNAENTVKTETVTDNKEVFRAYLSTAIDSVNRLLDFVKKYPDNDLFSTKTREFFSRINEQLEA